MLENVKLKDECKVYDMSHRGANTEPLDLDFDSLIPETDDLTEAELTAVAEAEIKCKTKQGFDCMPTYILEGLLEYFLRKRDFRSALWITIQANTGLRYSDVIKFRRIDLLDANNKFRESILETERKTGKQRVNFINDAIKMAMLMYTWNYRDVKPLDLLITAAANSTAKTTGAVGKKVKYITPDGKKRCLRVNGHYVYEHDENGEKIMEGLSRCQSSNIMRDALVNGLGISIKNDKRTKSNDDAYLSLASHSLRKAYAAGVVEQFVKLFDSDLAYAHAAAMEQLQYDLNHSSRSMTYHYIGDYIETKKATNMNMNLGAGVLRPYFEKEKEKYLKSRQK